VPDKLPPEVIEHWPEIFKDVEIKAVPVEYVSSVIVTFDDGKVWEIELDQEKIKENGGDVAETLEDTLDSFFAEYDEYIESVDFRLDTEQVIKDIKARTKQFLKKRK